MFSMLRMVGGIFGEGSPNPTIAHEPMAEMIGLWCRASAIMQASKHSLVAV